MYTETLNVWESSARSPEEAKSLQLRAQMMLTLRQIIRENGWNQQAAAAHLGISQPRVSYIYNGQVSKFNMEKLLGLLGKVGYDFSFARDDDGVPRFVTQAA